MLTLAPEVRAADTPAPSAQAAPAPQSAPLGCAAATIPENAPNPRVRVTTNLGSFVIELLRDRAPFTVYNFCKYVHAGQYTHTLFHRVIANFVIQGGGHDATPPDYALKPTERPIPNESGNGLHNMRGTVGMARGGSPHSANDQFYINLSDNSELDPVPTRWGYAVFGRVIEGMSVVDAIAVVPTGSCADERASSGFACSPAAQKVFTSDWPLTPVVIEKIEELPAGATVQEAPSAPVPSSTTPPVLAPK